MLSKRTIDKLINDWMRKTMDINYTSFVEYLQEKEYLDEYEIRNEFGDEFEVGDIVRVANWGAEFSTNPGWVAENVDDKTLAACYCYGDSSQYCKFATRDEDTEKYKILALDSDKDKAYIARKRDVERAKVKAFKCYVVGTYGLELKVE